MTRPYPDDPAGPYDPPPRSFEDGEGRPIEIGSLEDASPGGDREALVEMYAAFDPEDRAQGIPPVGEAKIRSWLDTVLAEDCLNVVAWHGRDAVGHAMLVPDYDGESTDRPAYELAIFVLAAYQGTGIGTRLVEALLGLGRETGVRDVWLTVERWNRPAMAVYEKVGFEPSDTSSFELEMSARLE